MHRLPHVSRPRPARLPYRLYGQKSASTHTPYARCYPLSAYTDVDEIDDRTMSLAHRSADRLFHPTCADRRIQAQATGIRGCGPRPRPSPQTPTSIRANYALIPRSCARPRRTSPRMSKRSRVQVARPKHHTMRPSSRDLSLRGSAARPPASPRATAIRTATRAERASARDAIYPWRRRVQTMGR